MTYSSIMPVFISPYADVILSALCVAFLWSGVVCLSIAGEKNARRSDSPWFWLGWGMLVLALREIHGLVELTGIVDLRIPERLFLAVAGAFVLLATQRAARGTGGPATLVKVTSFLFLFLFGAGAVNPYLGTHQADGSTITFSAIIDAAVPCSLALVCGVLLLTSFRRKATDPKGPVPVLALFFVQALLVAVLSPAGNRSVAAPGADGPVLLALHLLRTVVAFAMAVMIWSRFALPLGVVRSVRRLPVAIMLAAALTGYVFVLLSAASHMRVVRSNLEADAWNAAAVIPPAALLKAGANPGSANEPDTAEALFGAARSLRYFVGHIPFKPQISAIAPGGDSGTARAVLDFVHHPAPSPWATTPRRVEQLWEAAKNGGALVESLDGERLATVIAVAPIADESGEIAGAAALSVPAAAMLREQFRFKFPALVLLPAVFLLVLLLFRDQLRSWRVGHSGGGAGTALAGTTDNGLAGVFITSGRGAGAVVVDANRKFADIAGRDRDSLVGSAAADCLDIPSPVLSGESGAEPFEMSLRRPDAPPVRLLASCRRLPDAPDGDARVWEAVDITRLKAAEEEARLDRDRLQMILDALPVAVFVKDPRGRYLVVNPAFNSFLGLPAGESAVGRSLADIYPAEGEADQASDDICRDMRGGVLVYDHRYASERVDGEKFIEVSKTMLQTGPSEDDHVIIGGVHDFTRRKHGENAGEQERNFLMRVINALPVACCFVDRDLIIRMCDDDFAREAGAKTPADLVGKAFDDTPFLPFPDRDTDEALLARGSGFSDDTLELRRNGQTRHLVLHRTVMPSRTGKVLGIVKSFWDATDLISATREARKSERARAEFLANMSREIRTPMNGIVGLADLIVNHAGADALRRLHAETIIRSAQTLQMVIDEILDVAATREGEDRFVLNSAPFPPLSLVEETAQIVGCVVETWNVDLTLDYDFSLPAILAGDARRLRQILAQILTTCSRLTADERLRLVVERDGDGIALRLFFRPGSGVGPDEVENLFAPTGANGDETRRLEPGITHDRAGPPAARRLAEAMGGRLDVSGQPSGEVRCEVVLPFTPLEHGDLPLSPPGLAGTNALVASPDRERAGAIRKSLEFAGAATAGTDSADGLQGALRDAKAEGKPFSVIILDGGLVAPGELASLIEVIHADGIGEGRRPADIILVVTPLMVQELPFDTSLVDHLLLPPICPSDLWYKTKLLADRDRPDAPARQSSTRTLRQASIPANVLLVEDNTINQMVALGILKRIGCSTTLARNGREAVEMATGGERTFDIILMDCIMPEMDGYEAATRIRLHEKTHPDAGRSVIVALTANSLTGDRERSLAAGMDDHLAKPITLDRMRECLLKYCSHLIAKDGMTSEGAE